MHYYLGAIGLLIFIIVIVALERREQQKKSSQATQESDNQINSGRAYNKPHPTEEEHRTAEQCHWRRQNTFSGLAVLLSVCAVGAAVFAYFAGRRQADSAQFQLEILRSEDRPFLFDNSNLPPTSNVSYIARFDPQLGRIVWGYVYKNYGKSVAYHVKTSVFLKIGGKRFKPTAETYGTSTSFVDIPPDYPLYGIGASDSMTETEAATILKQDGALKMLVIFDYSNASMTERYESGYCMEHFSDGTAKMHTQNECRD